MSRIIIAVGGSGQMVLHYYAQLYLVGGITEVFDAFVLDSANPVRSLDFLSSFFDDVRQAMGGEAVPEIRFIPLEHGSPGTTVAQMLTTAALPQQPGFHHPAQAFFSRETLLQDVRQGLFARPALSTVMALRPALEEIQPLRLPRDARVVLVCSCIGGTGGGIAVPLLWHLTKTPGASLQVRAVLLGEYFMPRPGDTVGQDVLRFRSNRIGLLKTLQQSVNELQLFCFIEEPKMEERDPQKEERSDHLPWPGNNQPYWQAAAGLEHLFRENVQAQAADFAGRCVAADRYGAELDRGACWERLNNGLGCVTDFLRRNVLAQIDREAPVRRIWGDDLVELLVRYRELMQRAGIKLAPGDFLREVDRAIRGVWHGKPGPYGLSQVFPECTPSSIRVEQIRQTAWTKPPEGMSTEPFRDRASALRRIASVLLFCALRRVGQ